MHYAAARRTLAGHSPVRTARALRSSARACAAAGRPGRSTGSLDAPGSALPPAPSRHRRAADPGATEMARTVLEQLGEQTLAPVQVVVVDQNDPTGATRPTYAGLEPLPARGGLAGRAGPVGRPQRGGADGRPATGSRSSTTTPRSHADFLEQHLEGLLRYDADLSTGASLAAVGAPVPDNYAHFRVADQWDSGNGMCHRALFEDLGLFDQQFDRQRRGDAEFGLRAQRAGRLVIHNPHAIRQPPQGGDRRAAHRRLLGRLPRAATARAPLPQPSMLYYTARYHTPRQAREDLIMGLAPSVVPYHLKRRVGAAPVAALSRRRRGTCPAGATGPPEPSGGRGHGARRAPDPARSHVTDRPPSSAPAPPFRLAVIGDTQHHRDADGRLCALEPVVAQLDRWAELVDELVLCAPLDPGPPPVGFAPYASRQHHDRAPAACRVATPWSPSWACSATWSLGRGPPGGWPARSTPSTSAAPATSGWSPSSRRGAPCPRRYAMYAGVWRGYDGEPRFFGLQRRLLASRWFGGPVSVYASPRPRAPPPRARSSAPPTPRSDWEAAGPAAEAKLGRLRGPESHAGPWRAVVVGRLTPNKNQQAALRGVARGPREPASTSTSTSSATGPERADLEALAADLGVDDAVRFRGALDHPAR